MFFLEEKKFFFDGEREKKKKIKRQHQKPGAGLPFIYKINGPSFPTSAAEIDPRDEAVSFSLPPRTGGGGFGEGGKGGGAARAAFSDFLSSPATFNSSPFPLSASANPRGTDNSAPLPTRLAYYFY